MKTKILIISSMIIGLIFLCGVTYAENDDQLELHGKKAGIPELLSQKMDRVDEPIQLKGPARLPQPAQVTKAASQEPVIAARPDSLIPDPSDKQAYAEYIAKKAIGYNIRQIVVGDKVIIGVQTGVSFKALQSYQDKNNGDWVVLVSKTLVYPGATPALYVVRMTADFKLIGDPMPIERKTAGQELVIAAAPNGAIPDPSDKQAYAEYIAKKAIGYNIRQIVVGDKVIIGVQTGVSFKALQSYQDKNGEWVVLVSRAIVYPGAVPALYIVRMTDDFKLIGDPIPIERKTADLIDSVIVHLPDGISSDGIKVYNRPGPAINNEYSDKLSVMDNISNRAGAVRSAGATISGQINTTSTGVIAAASTLKNKENK